jgi:ketosteroid isomerase-like protein
MAEPRLAWCMKRFLLAFALAACASAPENAVTTAPVIAAERAFAARSGEVGWVVAFRENIAPDGEITQPGAVYANGPRSLAETPDDGNRTLFWWPAFAGISRSGDFGFTTGPVSFDEAHTPRGHYFTVWRRQPDGGWKWIYDGGVGPIANPAQIEIRAANVPSLPIATRGAASADAAETQIQALEQAGQFAYAADARSYRTRAAPMAGEPTDVPTGIVYDVHRVEASEAGDLAMVLGVARWPSEAGEARGLYARMWQLRPEGWRVVYDQLAPPPPQRPSQPAN